MQNFFFGVRGELDGLRIDPCLPSDEEYRECKFSISFRGARYDIRFNNPKLLRDASPLSIKVDGKELKGNIIKPFKDGKTHIVEVLLGKENKK